MQTQFDDETPGAGLAEVGNEATWDDPLGCIQCRVIEFIGFVGFN